jgi:hypothetical protein
MEVLSMIRLLTGALLTMCAVYAGTIAIDMGSTTPNGGNTVQFQGQTDGWEFSLSSAITVTDLGVFATQPGAGLGEAHAVGIWDTAGNLLVSATVPAGTGGNLIDSFFYMGVNSTLLSAGTYIIATEYDVTNPDLMYANLSSTDFSAASPVAWIQNEAGGNQVNVLTFPTFTFPQQDDGWFGPNFQFTSANTAVPESSAFLGVSFMLIMLKKTLTKHKSERILRLY